MKSLGMLVVATLLAVSFGSTQAAAKKSRADYVSYAGEPVREMRFSSLHNWQLEDSTSLIVWTRPTQAYLLTLGQPCLGLNGGASVALQSRDGISGRIESGSADVVAGSHRCPISAIQPIDLAQMKLDRHS